MKLKNDTLISYFKQNEQFADFFNQVLYHGRKVISPSTLVSVESEYIMNNGEDLYLTTTRDILKAVMKKDDHHTYLMLAIEGQSSVDFSMVFRALKYDVMFYNDQIQSIKNTHHALRSSDRLIPCLTVVLYTGSGEWSAATSFSSLLDMSPDDIMRHYMPEYHLLVIDPKKYTRKQISEFSTDVGAVFNLFRVLYSKDKSVEKDYNVNEMKTITPLGFNFIKAATGFDMDYEELKKGEVNTLTIKDYLLNEGRHEGITEGELKQQLKMLKKFLSKKMSEEEIIDLLDITKEELDYLMKQL